MNGSYVNQDPISATNVSHKCLILRGIQNSEAVEAQEPKEGISHSFTDFGEPNLGQ